MIHLWFLMSRLIYIFLVCLETVYGEDVCSVLAKIIRTIHKANNLLNREQNLQVIKSYKNKVNNMCKNPCNVLKVTRPEMEIEKHCMTSR